MKKTPTGRGRRGAAVAMIIMLLAAVQLVVVGGLGGAADEADQGVRRLLGVRTIYAADGAGLIIARQVRDGLAVPAVGASWTLGSSTATVTSAPAALTAGTIVVDVHSDAATRRLEITVDLTVP